MGHPNGYYKLSKNSAAQQPYHFVLVAPNNEIILKSENYTTSQSARKGIDSVRVHGTGASNFECKISTSGQPYFVLKAKNGEVIGTSQMYKTEGSRDAGIKAVMKYAGKADLVDESSDMGNGEGPIITTQPSRSSSNKYA